MHLGPVRESVRGGEHERVACAQWSGADCVDNMINEDGHQWHLVDCRDGKTRAGSARRASDQASDSTGVASGTWA